MGLERFLKVLTYTTIETDSYTCLTIYEYISAYQNIYFEIILFYTFKE